MIFKWGRAPQVEQGKDQEDIKTLIEREWSSIEIALEKDARYFDDVLKRVAEVFMKAASAYQTEHPNADINELSQPYDEQVWVRFGEERPVERTRSLTRIFVTMPTELKSGLDHIKIKYPPIMDENGIRSHEVDRAITIELMQWFSVRYANTLDVSIGIGPEEGTSLTLSVRSIRKGIALAEHLKVTAPVIDVEPMASSTKMIKDGSLD